jgi:DNA-binding NarL/FixJ family response regulator
MALHVLVVSDVKLVRDGVMLALCQQKGLQVVGTADTCEAREQNELLRPDVLLLDVTRQESLDRVRELVAAAPACKVVAFGVRETGEEILAIAAAGTAGYISASADACDVARVLERVLCDELPCSPRTAASLFRGIAALCRPGEESAPSIAESRAGSLSARELQVAYLIDRGLTNKQIARRLRIEAATVKNHVHNMCRKLQVHHRGQAVARLRAFLRSRAPLLAAAPDRDGPALDTN